MIGHSNEIAVDALFISTKLLAPLGTNSHTDSQQQSTCRSQIYYEVFGSDKLDNSCYRIGGVYLSLSSLSKRDNSFMNCEDITSIRIDAVLMFMLR